MVGRGRGAFRSKNTEVNLGANKSPNNPPEEKATVNATDEVNKMNKFISNISLLDPGDDGIMMKQKVKHIIDIFKTECPTEESIRGTVDFIYKIATHDSVFATKMVSLFSYTDPKLLSDISNSRKYFIGFMQEDFENLSGNAELRNSNPFVFRNTVQILGDFAHKYYIKKGFKNFFKPLLKYLELLLETGQEEDCKFFVIQLSLHGSDIKTAVPKDTEDLLLLVRTTLANNEHLTAVAKMWLLLILDFDNYNFGLLPSELQNFYSLQLGEDAARHFQKMNELTIQTVHTNAAFDKLTSDVNVLKVDNTDVYEQHTGEFDGPKPSFRRERYLAKAQTYKKVIPNDLPSVNNVTPSKYSSTPKDNTPRPILGAGARLKKATSPATASGDFNWRERGAGDAPEWREIKSDLNPAAAGWENKPKATSGSGWNDAGSSSKPWNQHDDRTETDYGKSS